LNKPRLESISRVNVLGVGVSVLNLTAALDAIARAVAERRKGYVSVTGVHGVSEAQDDPEFRRILNRAFLNTPDGMPMVWLGRLAGHRAMGRVYGPDLMTLVMRESVAPGWRHFFYGGTNGTAEQLRAVLTEKFPGLQVTGTYEPPFRPLNDTEQAALTAQVAAAMPDMFWVGLSTPKQERFMAANLDRLDTTLMLGVGAAFDMLAGTKSQAPRWMQRSGLEWFYRLCQEPRRLGPRYLRNNPLFALRVLGQLMGLRKYELKQ
jgi:N-acetylglucosaminyldiphosphoundecaprenol N-acetyl-beta-D-mannosaminyltransferase